MRTTKLLLLNPTSPSRRAEASHRPRSPRVFRFSMLSSLSVAAAMPPEVEVRIIDEDIEPIDYAAQPDLVGISCMTYNAPRAYEIADRFRAQHTPVILGGYLWHRGPAADESKVSHRRKLVWIAAIALVSGMTAVFAALRMDGQ